MLRPILSVQLSVRPSVRHTPVLCQKEGTQRDAVFTIGQPSVSSFLTPRVIDGDDPVQVKFECKEVDPVKTPELYVFRLIALEP